MRNKQRIRVYSKAAPSWYAEAMLTHRKGTDGEDLYIIDSVSGKLLMRKIDGSESLGVSMSDSEIEGLRAAHFGKMIAIHNHPTNIPPSGSDFGVAGYRGYKFGIVVTHTGRVYKYECGKEPFLPQLFDGRVDKYTTPDYNLSIEKAHKRVLKEFVKEYGISWEEIV